MNRRASHLVLGVLGLLLLAGRAHAVKTTGVELGTGGSYDGTVSISRDEMGRMTFRDAQVTSPTTLWLLRGNAMMHSELGGLDADDHLQYLTQGRHNAAHSAEANAALPIPADPAGHVTLGGHLADNNLHLRRDADETVTGAWRFSSVPEFEAGAMRISNGGAQGDAWLLFEDGADDAGLGWSDASQAFTFNRALEGTESRWDSVVADSLRARASLSGRNDVGDRAAALEGFQAIEGIAAPDLVSRSRAEEISGAWRFTGPVELSGGVTGDGSGLSGLERNAARVLTVSMPGDGGEYTTLANALAAAAALSPTITAPATIVVYPGTYVERNTVALSNVAIVGASPAREKYVIEWNHFEAGTGAMNVGDPTLDVDGATNVTIANLTIRNTYADTTGGFAPAFASHNSTVTARNCYIGGNGGRDICTAWGTGSLTLEDCLVEQYNAGSASSHALWAANSASITMRDCTYSVFGSGDGADLSTSGNQTFLNCRFVFGSTTRCPFAEVTGGNLTVLGCSGTSLVWPPSTYTPASAVVSHNSGFAGITVSGQAVVTGGAEFLGNQLLYMRTTDEPPMDGTSMGPTGLQWGTYAASTYTFDTNLYRSAANTLKTDDAFDAASLKVGGTEIISSARAVAAAGLNNTSTSWEDFPAGAAAGTGAQTFYEFDAGTGDASLSVYGWMASGASGAAATHVIATTAAVVAYFPVPYRPGSIITRLRVESQAGGANDGVKLRLVKRALKSTGWTTVGAQQTYTDPAAPFPITLCSGSPESYDLPDETLAPDTLYAIEVESVVATTSTALYSVGIETSKRAY